MPKPRFHASFQAGLWRVLVKSLTQPGSVVDTTGPGLGQVLLTAARHAGFPAMNGNRTRLVWLSLLDLTSQN